MDTMLIVESVFRFLHIFTAIMLIGGSVFSLMVLNPILEKMEDKAAGSLKQSVVDRWKKFVHIGILVFIVSGLYVYMVSIKDHRGDGLYHALIGIKMILALGLFFIASALVGRSKKFEFLRRTPKKALSIVVLLAMIIVGIASTMKTRGPMNKTEKTPEANVNQLQNEPKSQ